MVLQQDSLSQDGELAESDTCSLSQNLMKPYPNRGQTEEQQILNYHLSRAHRGSENAFDIFSSKFRVFLSTLCVKPDNATIIVHAALALHNYLLWKCPNMYTPPGSMDTQNGHGGIIVGDQWKSAESCIVQDINIPGSNHTRNAAAESMSMNLAWCHSNGKSCFLCHFHSKQLKHAV